MSASKSTIVRNFTIGCSATLELPCSHLSEKEIFTLHFFGHRHRCLGLYLPDFIFGKSGKTSESIPYDSTALLLCLLSEQLQLYLEHQREWIILYKSPCDRGMSFKRWMGRLLYLFNGKDGSGGCLNKAPLQITVLQRTSRN